MPSFLSRKNLVIFIGALTAIIHVLQGVVEELPPDEPVPCVVVAETPVLLPSP